MESNGIWGCHRTSRRAKNPRSLRSPWACLSSSASSRVVPLALVRIQVRVEAFKVIELGSGFTRRI